MTTISFSQAFDLILANFFLNVPPGGTFNGFNGSVIGYDGENL